MASNETDPAIATAQAQQQPEFTDLSGISNADYHNPYDALIEAAENDPKRIQQFYATHRTKRNAQQKEKLLSPDFPGFTLDTILQRRLNPSIEPGYTDPRNCLVFWARPTAEVRNLISVVQSKLLDVVPHLWTMPLPNLHLTVLEVTHSLPATSISALISSIAPAALERITDYTFAPAHRARLIRPMLSFDAAALALSWEPAADEDKNGEPFTYHHLRRDVFNLCAEAGVSINSRYVVPSCHLTVGRFVDAGDFTGEEGKVNAGKVNVGKVKTLVERIEEINAWLRESYWGVDENQREGIEWVVGQEKGLDCQSGTLWYGDGDRVRLGKGF